MSDSYDLSEQRRLVLLLGDQLSPDISALRHADRRRDRILMAEVAREATYMRHHKKKIAFLFSAMRHFAAELTDVGWAVDYVKLDDEENSGSLPGELERALRRHKCHQVLVTEPGEWRLSTDREDLRGRLDVPLDIVEDDRFICSKSEFAQWVAGRRQLRMENFYRHMGRKTGLLKDGDEPVGGRWNYDSENR